MRYLILALSIIPLESFGQWSFDAFYKGSDTSSAIVFPIDYSSNTCLFAFDILGNNIQEDVIVDNKGCNDHWLVIDDFAYQLPTFNYEYSPVNPDQHFFNGDIELINCSRISNNLITISNPGLNVTQKVIGLNPNQPISIFNWEGSTYFKFSSFDGDIYCNNGVSIGGLFDLIYKGGFE